MSEFEDKNYPYWGSGPADKESKEEIKGIKDSQETLKRVEVKKPKCRKCGDSGWVEECRTVWADEKNKSASTCGFSWWHVRCDGEAHKDEIFMGEEEHRIILGEDTKKRNDVVSFSGTFNAKRN